MEPIRGKHHKGPITYQRHKQVDSSLFHSGHSKSRTGSRDCYYSLFLQTNIALQTKASIDVGSAQIPLSFQQGSYCLYSFLLSFPIGTHSRKEA